MQIAKAIFHNNLYIMKKILDLGEFKLGKKSDDYKYFKKEVMNSTYDSLKKLFKQLFDEKIIKKCNKKCNLRQGYSDCECGGSGYIDGKEN
jgi:hypothetical protein